MRNDCTHHCRVEASLDHTVAKEHICAEYEICPFIVHYKLATLVSAIT